MEMRKTGFVKKGRGIKLLVDNGSTNILWTCWLKKVWLTDFLVVDVVDSVHLTVQHWLRSQYFVFCDNRSESQTQKTLNFPFQFMRRGCEADRGNVPLSFCDCGNACWDSSRLNACSSWKNVLQPSWVCCLGQESPANWENRGCHIKSVYYYQSNKYVLISKRGLWSRNDQLENLPEINIFIFGVAKLFTSSWLVSRWLVSKLDVEGCSKVHHDKVEKENS